ncbi:MAG: hypothetical protein GY842_02670, partial [bacterium]|nr:hypothetical protein [bacterium]
DAERWRLHMVASGRAPNTIRRATGWNRQLFKAAERQELITRNPFADLPASVLPSPEKFHYVSREDTTAVLEACPDAEPGLFTNLPRVA